MFINSIYCLVHLSWLLLSIKVILPQKTVSEKIRNYFFIPCIPTAFPEAGIDPHP